MVIGLGVLYGILCAPLAAFWAELFDTRTRYTAIGSVYQLSGIVASGLTPLIAALLVSRNGGNLWYVAAYTIGVALVSFVCSSLLPETLGRDLDRSVREAPDGAVPVEGSGRRIAA
jgi:MFS family permease